MDKITLDRINTFHPDFREKLLAEYTECNNKLLGKGVRLRFAYVYRSIEEQDKLYAKRPKVTNAKGGQSIHNYGLAFDIVLLYDNDGNGTFEEASWSLRKDGDKDGKADWMEVVDYFKSKGWEWGGDWKSFKDYPHFQLKKEDGSSYNWRELKSKLDNKNFIINEGIKYPVL
jgi:peptidoglycan L-alanyl-D-glutamate endopeptidase CwlK